MPRLRILFVSPRFGASAGGVEIHLREVGSRLVAAGHQVVVLAGDETHDLPDREDVLGIQVWRIPAWPKDWDWQIAPGIVPAVLRTRWDIVHVQSYHTGVAPFGLAAATMTRRPTVLTFHSGGQSSGLRGALRQVQLLVLRPWILAVNALVAVSNFERDELSKRLRIRRSRFVVIPNGADLGRVAADEPERAPTPGLLLSVGRLEAYKGHDQVIRALSHVRETLPNAVLQIVGSGPDEARLRQLAEQSGVGDSVTFVRVPVHDRTAMRELLRSASGVILLSDYESQGIAAYEALAAGTPVIVTNATAFRELVSKGLATGVPRGSSPRQIAAAIVSGLALRPRAATLPTWDATASALDSLYHSVLRG